MSKQQLLRELANLNKTAVIPESSDFQAGAGATGRWYKLENGRIKQYEQIVGSSGVYLVVEDYETGETLRDDRPWAMTT